MKKQLSIEKRQKLTENTSCMLNDKHAVIRGRLRKFAVIAEQNGPLAAEYAWATVERIVNAGGKFKI